MIHEKCRLIPIDVVWRMREKPASVAFLHRLVAGKNYGTGIMKKRIEFFLRQTCKLVDSKVTFYSYLTRLMR